ncbi:MAG: hypothetical protein K0R80_1550 [Clostridia bacterium]|jgi:hypothetical protein|nr:hypothetical protein [Clostridia bacterium]
MKKITAMLLVSILFLTLISACKSSELSDQEIIQINDLGDASFILSETSVSEEYKPSQGAKTLSLVDVDGNEWKLIIPQNALLYDETISMQLISDIKQDVLNGNKIGGVVLKPEGLHFINPVYLNVKGPLVSEQSCVLGGTSEGKALNFSKAVFSDNTLIAEIEHFSSYFTYTPTSDHELQELAQKAEADYIETVKEIKAFLKTPVSVPPIPLDFEFTCDIQSERRPVSLYISQAVQPEKDLIIKMLAAGNRTHLTGGNEDSIEYARQLQERLIKKVDKLISTYKNDNKKLIPVMNLSFIVLKDASRLGMDTSFSPYFETFSDWMEQTAEEQVERIKENHDYTALCKVMVLMQGRAIIAQDFNQTMELSEEYKEKLRDALTFTLAMEGEVTDRDSEGGISIWKTSGEVLLEFDMEALAHQKQFLTGGGQCEFTDYTLSGKRDTKLASSSTEVNAKAYLISTDEDKYEIKLSINRIAPDTINYTDSDGLQFSLNGNHYLYANLFAENYDGINFSIPMNLKKGLDQMTVAISGTEANSTGTYEFTLKHTPR